MVKHGSVLAQPSIPGGPADLRPGAGSVHLLLEEGEELGFRDAALLHAVALAEGEGVAGLLDGLEVDGDAPGWAGLVLAAAMSEQTAAQRGVEAGRGRARQQAQAGARIAFVARLRNGRAGGGGALRLWSCTGKAEHLGRE